MNTQKIIGVISLVIGVLLLVWGHNMAQSIGGQLQNTFTGSPGDKPMYLYVGGAVLCAVGVFQLFWKRK
jgi:type II secretory pathway component PulM